MVVSIYEARMHDSSLGIQRLPSIEAVSEVGVGANLHDA